MVVLHTPSLRMCTVFTLRPRGCIHFIPADMNKCAGKELHRLIKDIGDELVRRLLTGTHHIRALEAWKLLAGMREVVKECRFADLIWVTCEELRVRGDRSLGMPGHLDFRHHFDMPGLCVGDNFTDIRLGVKPAVTPNRRLFPPRRLAC